MRITKNDVSANIYSAIESKNARGQVTKAYTLVGAVLADWQPIGARVDLKAYGIDNTMQDVWKIFADNAAQFPINCIAVKDSLNYVCVASKKWYDHAECIFIPWKGSLT